MSYDALESSRFGGAPFELYRFTMGDQAWHLTSGEEARTHAGQIYAPDTIERTEIEHNNETSSGNIEITVPLESLLAKEFISFVPPYPMWLTIYAGHDGDAEVIVRFKGRVQMAKFTDVCIMTVESGTNAIRKKIPPLVYQQSCNRIHTSPQCGAVVQSWTLDVQAFGDDVIAYPGNTHDTRTIAIWSSGSTGAQADSFRDFWQPNVVAGEVGDDKPIPSLAWGVAMTADGRRMMIERHTSVWNVIVVKAPIYGLGLGDLLTVSMGCRRTIKHCAYYGRTSSFMGFDQMPSKNPFTGVA